MAIRWREKYQVTSSLAYARVFDAVSPFHCTVTADETLGDEENNKSDKLHTCLLSSSNGPDLQTPTDFLEQVTRRAKPENLRREPLREVSRDVTFLFSMLPTSHTK